MEVTGSYGQLAERRTASRLRARLAPAIVLCVLSPIIGCSDNETKTALISPFDEPVTFAVAPILNFSGEFSLDPLKAADLLASELTHVDGISVLPVNRVAAFLAMQGKQQIESPAHAIEVAEAIGADAMLVAGIMEYDAYTPVVGLALQMYAVPTHHATPVMDPVTASRHAQPMTIVEMADALSPMGQVQRVYNATHRPIVRAVERYAKLRSEGDNAFGWRQYLKSQTLFLRFCWHDAITSLMDQQREARTVLAGDPSLEIR